MKTNKSPLVSIITVVFNGSKTLEQTIQSVLNQSYNNIEYIIIDGGSTDGTLDIIKKYENKITFWISEKDNGLYHAMNKGISYSKGEIIGIINSDDWYETNAIEMIVETFNNNPDKKIFHGDRFDIDSNNQKRLYRYNKSKLKFLIFSMTYNHPSMFIHKDVYLDFKYNDKFRSISDYEFTLKVYLNDKNVFCYIPTPYVNYRLDGISAKQNLISEIKEGAKARINAGLPFYYIIPFIILKFIHFTFKRIFKIKYF